MSQNLEILPVNSNHVVYQGGQLICRFNTIKQAEAFVLSELLGNYEQPSSPVSTGHPPR
jgi:hypothetical protein